MYARLSFFLTLAAIGAAHAAPPSPTVPGVFPVPPAPSGAIPAMTRPQQPAATLPPSLPAYLFRPPLAPVPHIPPGLPRGEERIEIQVLDPRRPLRVPPPAMESQP